MTLTCYGPRFGCVVCTQHTRNQSNKKPNKSALSASACPPTSLVLPSKAGIKSSIVVPNFLLTPDDDDDEEEEEEEEEERGEETSTRGIASGSNNRLLSKLHFPLCTSGTSVRDDLLDTEADEKAEKERLLALPRRKCTAAGPSFVESLRNCLASPPAYCAICLACRFCISRCSRIPSRISLSVFFMESAKSKASKELARMDLRGSFSILNGEP